MAALRSFGSTMKASARLEALRWVICSLTSVLTAAEARNSLRRGRRPAGLGGLDSRPMLRASAPSAMSPAGPDRFLRWDINQDSLPAVFRRFTNENGPEDESEQHNGNGQQNGGYTAQGMLRIGVQGARKSRGSVLGGEQAE